MLMLTFTGGSAVELSVVDVVRCRGAAVASEVCRAGGAAAWETEGASGVHQDSGRE